MPAMSFAFRNGKVVASQDLHVRDSNSVNVHHYVRQMMECRSQNFHCAFQYCSKTGQVNVAVTVSQSLVEHLPLFADIKSSTRSGKSKGEEKEGQRVSCDAPSSILGLVSALLLRERLITANQCFGENAVHNNEFKDPELNPIHAISALQMADFLGLKVVRSDALRWFRTFMHNLARVERRGGSKPMQVMQITQVLTTELQPHFYFEICDRLAKNMKTNGNCNVLDLPEEVVCMWINSCGSTLNLIGSHALMAYQLEKALRCVVTSKPALKHLHIHGPQERMAKSRDVLHALHAACSCLGNLQVLELEGLHINAGSVRLLNRVLGAVAGSLEELSISKFDELESRQKAHYDSTSAIAFFEAIAQLQKLRILTMDGAKDFACNSVVSEDTAFAAILRVNPKKPQAAVCSTGSDFGDIYFEDDESSEDGESSEDEPDPTPRVSTARRVKALEPSRSATRFGKKRKYGDALEGATVKERCAVAVRRVLSPLLKLTHLKEIQVSEVNDSLFFTAEPRLTFTEG